MSWYPNAVRKPLPEATREPLITATQVIVHSAVSGAASLFGFFSRDDVVLESHFYVDESGVVEEYVGTERQADANRTANVRAISIETWDDRDPDHVPWNEAQLASLAELIAWCCKTHGIPAQKCAGPSGPGIGWHTMWGAPSPWTPVSKTCPGVARVPQMPGLIARVQSIVNGGILMALTDAEQRELLSKVRLLAGVDPVEDSDIAGGEVRASFKTLVQGSVLDGLREKDDDHPGRGVLRGELIDILNEVLDARLGPAEPTDPSVPPTG